MKGVRSNVRRVRLNRLRSPSIVRDEPRLVSADRSSESLTLTYLDVGSEISVYKEGSEKAFVVQSATVKRIKDYKKEDPSFLNEFDSSEEKFIPISEVSEEAEPGIVQEKEESSSDPDCYAVYEKLLPDGSYDIHDLICADKTVESTDSIFKEEFYCTERRTGEKVRSKPVECLSDFRVENRKYLPNCARSSLVSAIAEAAFLNVSDPVEYIAGYLNHQTKSREELGLDPEPRIIENLVRSSLKVKQVSRMPMLSSMDKQSYLYSTVCKPLVPDLKEYDLSQVKKLKEEYAITKENQAKVKSSYRRLAKELDQKKDCLGPTSLVNGNLPHRGRTEQLKLNL